MAKYLFLFLLLTAFMLLYPFRDLYVREDAFSSEYTLVSKGFWTREACEEAARAQQAKDYRCSRRTMFGSMMGTSAKYAESDLHAID